MIGGKRENHTGWKVILIRQVLSILLFLCRKHIRVSKVVVHENFSTVNSTVNDIALLKLGEFISSKTLKLWFKKTPKFYFSLFNFECLINFITEERVNLTKYPPACLPEDGESFPVGSAAFVYGGWGLVNCPTWWYLSLIFGFLWWSSIFLFSVNKEI